MSNILIIKLSDNSCMTHYRVDQDYSSIATIVNDLISEYHSDKTATAYALASSENLDAAINTNSLSINDINVTEKQNIAGGDVAVTQDGVNLVDMANNDNVVSYTPVA